MQELRVTSLDEAFVNLANDAVMSVHFEVRVAGRLDADKLTRAIKEAMAAHPLSRARLRAPTLGTRTLTWQIDDEADFFALEVVDGLPDRPGTGCSRCRRTCPRVRPSARCWCARTVGID